MNVRRVPMIALWMAAMLGGATPAAAQDGRGPVVLEVRGGMGHHAGGDCGGPNAQKTAPTLGVDVRTRGRLFASAALDLFVEGYSCVGVGWQTEYQGQTVDVRGWPSVGPRLAVSVGFAQEIRGSVLELTLGLGTIMEGDAEASGTDTTLRAWRGGALTLRFPSGPSVFFEDGHHRILTKRYYLAGTDERVAEFDRWARMWRVGVSVPVAG